MTVEMVAKTTLSVSEEVRNEVRSLKRGQMTYSELLTEMMEQYDPDQSQD
jgi:predicted CopG family antitoxin